jgi:2-succinyl-5-enolpyruvyl-6-hydroxy-3-cyclohexene-1-carboxylate synthase
MVKNKQTVLDLVMVCHAKGIRKVVFSPGSRNAPLIIAFNEFKEFETFSIPDERVAAFFALGMAQQSGETVAIISTSGSAALNYAPALAEAYYQRIPLLVITADRPPEWIDQGNGQTMRQRNLYQNFIKSSYEISHETNHDDELWFNIRIYNEAINNTKIEPKGPVHINFPLREPLYDIKIDFEKRAHIKIIDQHSPPPELSDGLLETLAEEWNRSRKKLILCGITQKSDALNEVLSKLAQDPSIVVMTESTSNLYDPAFIEQIDRVLFAMKEEDFASYQPELLITLGTNIISKKIKFLFRKWNIREHWHIDETDIVIDTFKSLTKHLRSDLVHFFKSMDKKNVALSSDFSQVWRQRNERLLERHESFIQQAPWSDFLAYAICLQHLPENSKVQMANSAGVRYVQLMEKRADISYYSNRGVAGIDGCSSTAVGAAWVNDTPTVLLTGDIAFLYDSNAFWQPYLKGNLRIIIFNNEGGNIFRIIPGPSSTQQLETFFEAHHRTKARHLAKAYDLNYLTADNEKDLRKLLPDFFSLNRNDRPSLLEIFTPRELNDKILKDYFKRLT